MTRPRPEPRPKPSSEPDAIDGILNVDKPPGITSMEVVRRIKRASQQKRVGHGGTLDPFATGVIPICLGQATRMMEYLVDGGKEYRATIELGVETDTYDTQGQVTSLADATHLSREEVEAALASFSGVTKQVPPMYSALKRQGQRLYDLARAGIEVEREPRKVEVYRIALETWRAPLATVYVSCGRGLYMRSLAHDLGQELGSGGSLKSLVRLRSGRFRVEDASTLDAAEQSFATGEWRRLLHAPDSAVYHLRAMVVGPRLDGRIRQGQPVPVGLSLPPSHPDEPSRVYSSDGRFVAVLSFEASVSQWQPVKVFDLRYIDSALVKG